MGTKLIGILFLQQLDVISTICKFPFLHRCFYKSAPVPRELALMDFLFLMIHKVIHENRFLSFSEIEKAEKSRLCFKAIFPAFISALSSEIFNQDIKLGVIWALATVAGCNSIPSRKRYSFPSVFIILNFIAKVKKDADSIACKIRYLIDPLLFPSLYCVKCLQIPWLFFPKLL